MYSEGYFLIMGYIGMCNLKRYGVSAVLVVNRVSNFWSGRQSRLIGRSPNSNFSGSIPWGTAIRVYQGELSVPRLYCYWCLKVLIALPWHDLFWLFQAVSQHITETQKRYVNLDNKEKKKIQIHCVEFLWQKKYKSARPTKKETEIRYSGGTVGSAYTHPLSPGSLSPTSCPPHPPPESSDLSKHREKSWNYVA